MTADASQSGWGITAPTSAGGVLGSPAPVAQSPFSAYGPTVEAAYTKALNSGVSGTQGLNTQAAEDAAFAAMTPTQQAQYSNTVYHGNTAGGFFNTVNKVAPYAILAVGAGATGGALSAGIGGLGGALAGGAAAGTITAAGSDAISGKPLTLGSVGKGALTGAVTGGLGYEAAPATQALVNSGVNSTAANALVKGGVGAGVGALGGALSGTGAANGALVGGATGAATGALGSATGSNLAGVAGGILGGELASKYLTSPTTAKPAVAPQPVAAPAAAPAAKVATPVAPAQSSAQPVAATAPAANIGSYSGFNSTGLGYQPMSQVNPNITNYNTYGQGPEASFFAPTPGTT